MSDIFTSTKRSEIMSRVRGRGNKSTEIRFINVMRQNKIIGWRWRSEVFGRPDFIFIKERIAIFIDGDIWHGNSKTSKMPKTNSVFWMTKIKQNRERDRKVSRHLRALGWSVVRIWESSLHRLPAKEVNRVIRLLTMKRRMISKS